MPKIVVVLQRVVDRFLLMPKIPSGCLRLFEVIKTKAGYVRQGLQVKYLNMLLVQQLGERV